MCLFFKAIRNTRDETIVLFFDRLSTFLDERFERRHVRCLKLVLVLMQRLLERVAEIVELVPALDLLTTHLVVRLVVGGFFDHLLNLGLTKTRARGNGDLLVFTGRRILRGYRQDSIRIDVEPLQLELHSTLLADFANGVLNAL